MRWSIRYQILVPLFLPDRGEVGFRLRRQLADHLVLLAPGLEDLDHALVGAQVLPSHGAIVEEQPCASGDVGAVHFEAALDLVVALDEVLDQHPGAADLDQLGHGAAGDRECRGAAEGGLEHPKAMSRTPAVA